jgi:hypothetical protein
VGNNQLLVKTINRLIDEARGVLATEFDAGLRGVSYVDRPRGVELQAFAKLRAGYANIIRLLGTAGDPWKDLLKDTSNTPVAVKRILGTLHAIAETLQNGLLISVEDLVRAETFDSLLTQADYLLSQTYFLAAGVLGRAVLEEHLRKWCDLQSCCPTKARPTMNDSKDSLYKAKQININQMKHIESLAAIGNDAAHNKPSLTTNEVERLLRDVREILVKHPLSAA